MTNTTSVKFEYQEKDGRAYVTTFSSDDAARVYEDLAHELISKKINSCTWIKSIKRRPMYNGFDEITVTYDHGGRRVYTVASH